MTMFLATVLGWYLVIISLFVIFKRESFQAVITDVLKNRSVVFILAIFNIIFGLLMVVSHNIWEMNWQVVVTVLSWLILIAGLARLFCLEDIIKKGKSFSLNPAKNISLGIILLIVGLFLLYHVFAGHHDLPRFF